MALKVVMTKRAELGPSRNLRTSTAADEPNPMIVAMPWWQRVAVRAARVYVQGLIGFLLANATGLGDNLGVPITDFTVALVVSAKLALAPAVLSLLQNTAEILGKLDVTLPEARG